MRNGEVDAGSVGSAILSLVLDTIDKPLTTTCTSTSTTTHCVNPCIRWTSYANVDVLVHVVVDGF